MGDRLLTPSGRYDPHRQFAVSLFAAFLDDQTELLRGQVKDWEPRHFEWQERPGRNTAGMLIAHCAMAEVWWLAIAWRGIPYKGAGEGMFAEILGIGPEDDGLPLAPDGAHPEALAGKTFEDYFEILGRAREATHAALHGWTDEDLAHTYEANNRTYTRRWTLYHAAEHFAQHAGQIGLLAHAMRDAGLLKGKGGD
ncbi:MAG: DUF664 domain-containing protein [Candidatus Sumerlaeia bacterium]|nr:DUF664 domain-containing protein [Candidatus Sumerlaeia bacterium]